MAEAAVIRALAFYGPLALVVASGALVRPDRRRAGAALLATLWTLTALLAVNVIAVQVGWWRFATVGGEVAGVPVEAWVGWALLWGAFPALLPERVPAVAVIAGLVWIDLGLMPLGHPVVVLGENWLVGETVAVVAALVPGLLLGRETVRRRSLAFRVGMQVALFTGLLGGVATQAVLEATGGSWARLRFDRPGVQLAVQAVAAVAVPALAAVGELARRGRGTPYPFDPPDRLVTTGPYAYVANPMQVSMVLALVVWGALLASWAVVALAVVGAAFAAGIAGWHEDADLRDRHGAAWDAYRRHVRTWWPRGRPWVETSAALYVAPGCAPCTGVGRWIAGRRPAGLEIRPATDAPHPLSRLTYVGGDGYEASGVAAFARALEHLHLGWAMLAWVLLLPGLGRFVQLVVDAVGGGPLAEPLGGSAPRTA